MVNEDLYVQDSVPAVASLNHSSSNDAAATLAQKLGTYIVKSSMVRSVLSDAAIVLQL